MKVKLCVSRCGDGDPQLPGQIIDVGDDEGQRLIADQQAVAADGSPSAPTADTRRAVKTPGQKR